MKYTALLKSAAQQLGYEVKWSPLQLVSGSINPPPTKKYPGLTCYMAQVRVGPYVYNGFGPTRPSARNFAASQAYDDLCYQLREERQKESRRGTADRLDSRAGESLAYKTTDHPLQSHSTWTTETSARSAYASSQHIGQEDVTLSHNEHRSGPSDEQFLTQFARECQTYFTTTRERRSGMAAVGSGSTTGDGLASDQSDVGEGIQYLSIGTQRSSVREGGEDGQLYSGKYTAGRDSSVQALPCWVAGGGESTRSPEEAVCSGPTVQPGLVGESSTGRCSSADLTSDSSPMETDDAIVSPSLPNNNDAVVSVGASVTDNPIGQLQELLMREKLPQPRYSMMTAQSVKGMELFHCVVSVEGFTGNGCGGRKKLAKKEAARNILVEMEKAGVCITVVSRARRKAQKKQASQNCRSVPLLTPKTPPTHPPKTLPPPLLQTPPIHLLHSPPLHLPHSPPLHLPHSPPLHSPQTPPPLSPQTPPLNSPQTPPIHTSQPPPLHSPQTPPPHSPQTPPLHSPKTPPPQTPPLPMSVVNSPSSSTTCASLLPSVPPLVAMPSTPLQESNREPISTDPPSALPPSGRTQPFPQTATLPRMPSALNNRHSYLRLPSSVRPPHMFPHAPPASSNGRPYHPSPHRPPYHPSPLRPPFLVPHAPPPSSNGRPYHPSPLRPPSPSYRGRILRPRYLHKYAFRPSFAPHEPGFVPRHPICHSNHPKYTSCLRFPRDLPANSHSPPTPPSLPNPCGVSPQMVGSITWSPPTSPHDGPLSPTSPRDRPLSPTSPHDGPLSPTSPRDRPLSPTSPRDRPLSPTSPRDRPLSPTSPCDSPLSPTSPPPPLPQTLMSPQDFLPPPLLTGDLSCPSSPDSSDDDIGHSLISCAGQDSEASYRPHPLAGRKESTPDLCQPSTPPHRSLPIHPLILMMQQRGGEGGGGKEEGWGEGEEGVEEESGEESGVEEEEGGGGELEWGVCCKVIEMAALPTQGRPPYLFN